jgi:ABC-2 type transport system permease protein
MNFRRTRAVARKELLHVVRDPQSLTAALVQPFIMLLLFGWALSMDVDHIPTIVYDHDHSPESRDLIRDFSGSRYFTILDTVNSYGPIERAIDTRKCLLAVVIPDDFAKNMQTGKEAQVQLLIDGSDSNTAAIALGYAEGVVGSYSQQVTVATMRMRSTSTSRQSGASSPSGGVEVRARVWYNPDLLSGNFIVPGLIAVILMVIAANLGSLTIAREWENGTMEQLLSTPVRPSELALGKLGAYFLIGVADMIMCLLMGMYGFNVPLKGSLTLLMVSSCIFLFGALGMGIMISAMNRTQLTAYQMGTLTSFLPAFLLSGFIYSIGNMPRIIQAVALVVPARYFMNIARGVFLKGIGLRVLWFDFLLLVVYGVIVFYFATRKLRQKVA